VKKDFGTRVERQRWALSSILLILSVNLQVSQGAPSGSQPDNCDNWLDQCFQYSVSTAHFAVFYNTTGRFSVSPEWARNVSTMAETAYTKLVLDEGFTPPARNPIPIYLDLVKGGFTNFLLCNLCPLTPTSLQHLQIEYRYRSPCPNDCGIPTSNWEVAHEVFHTIQYTQFNGSLPFGRWLAEGSANWAGYTVAGNESRWDPWVISAWLGPNGTTEKAFDERTYDNAFFLVFLSDHYGGPEIIKRIMANANRETTADGVVVSQLRALGYNSTFTEVLNEFATAILTGNFTDRDGATAVLREPPPIGATAKWTGTNETVARFTGEVNGFAAGDPLQVRVPDGIEYVKVEPTSNTTLSVNLRAQDRSCFEATVVTRLSNSSKTYRVTLSRPVIVVSPDRYDQVFVAVTRGRCSSGDFSIDLGGTSSHGSRLPPPTPEPLVIASVLAILLILVASAAWLQHRRKLWSNLGS